MAGTNLSPARQRDTCSALVAMVFTLLLSACDGATSKEPGIGNATGSDVSADLSDDALLAPTPPVLEITIQPGTLNFAWNNVIAATRTSLYAFDTITRNEWLLSDEIGADDTQFSVPTVTHQLPWHSRQYRIELCDADDCVSSLRVALSGRASDSMQTLSPAVFLSGEAFGQSVAINDSGTVAAIAEPLSGSVTIYARNNTDWTYYGSTDISTVVSGTRTFDMAMSTSGDTIAVYTNETDVNETNDSTSIISNTKPRIVILERLGESWFTTMELDVSTLHGRQSDRDIPNNDNINDAIPLDDAQLYLSGDGERVLLSTPESLVLFSEQTGSWQPTVLVDATPGKRLITSLGVSRSLETIHVASIDEAGIAVQQLNIAADEVVTTQAYPLPMLAPSSDIQLASSAAGDKLVVLAWEHRLDARLIPVAWQYESRTVGTMPSDSTAAGTPANEMPGLQLDVERSLRLAEASDIATLKLAANHDLSTIAFAWQSVADAALISVVADNSSTANNPLWQHALELPQATPAFAKTGFAGHLAMSHDGTVLMVSVPRDQALALSEALNTTEVNTGQILILQ